MLTTNVSKDFATVKGENENSTPKKNRVTIGQDNPGDYEFFDASPSFPDDGALTAAYGKLEIVRHENDHLSRLLPDSENGFNAFNHVLKAYLSQQILMVIECTVETNRHILELNGRDNTHYEEWASFQTLYKIGVLPQEVIRPMQQSIKRLRGAIAHPKRTREIAEFYTKVLLFVDVIRHYIEHVESHLEAQSELLANAVREQVQQVEAQY